jgi:ribonuclease J
MGKEKLRIIPMGGVGEIGKNMTLVEYGENILVIDAGLMFPENDMFGIDIIIPDMTYLLEHRDWIRGIIITHGHEDHTGALPYLLSQVPNVPIYATRLTQGLVEIKLKEHKMRAAEFHTISSDDVLDLAPFQIEFFHVSHSIPDGVGLAIRTPLGVVVHSGDFKFDHSPVDGQRTNFAKLADLGREGVLLLLSDSTNAETPGYTPSEQEILKTFEQAFLQAKGRVIVATFASNISRVQQVIDVAARYGRYVAVIGRSMVNNMRMAQDLGYLHVPEDILLNGDDIRYLPPEKVALVCTGSQGEPTSALVRMASRDARAIKLQPGDTVIISATPIPGNEELVNRTINNLFRLGAAVYYDELFDVHVSGHASQEEQKLMLNLLHPKMFVPVHGEYRHLVLHAKMAEQAGVSPENVFVLESGDVLELDGASARVVDKVAQDYVFVDGLGVGDIGEAVLGDRRVLSQNGFVVVSVVVDAKIGIVLSKPQVVSRGLVHNIESGKLLQDIEDQVLKVVKEGGSARTISDRLKDSLARIVYDAVGRRPMIIPLVSEV